MKKLPARGYLRAYHNIGIVYQHGLGGIPTDYNKAFNYFLKAANEESTEPYFCIGNCYLNGLGVEKMKRKQPAGFKRQQNWESQTPCSIWLGCIKKVSELNGTVNYLQNISIRQQKPDGNLLLEL